MASPGKVLRWEAPPPSKSRTPSGSFNRHSVHEALAAELRACPGVWALVMDTVSYTKAARLAATVRLGLVRCFNPTGSFDATVRTVDGRALVYARYVTDEETKA